MIVTALIGSPVDHSVSSILFNLYAKEHNLEYTHAKFDVKVEDLKKVITSLGAYGFSGVNITLPYKSKVIQFMDEISPEAQAIGAVNTIKINGNKLVGFNTDAYGAQRAIEKAMQRKLDSQDLAIVFGTGGASRAIVWCLIQQGVKVAVVYREPESSNTETLMDDFGNKVKFIKYSDLSVADLEKQSIICNATSIGMYPNSDESPLDFKKFDSVNLSSVIVFDAIFNPIKTRFQVWAEKRGAVLAYGIDMMIYQGVVAFEYWTKKQVGATTIQKASNILMKNI